MLMSELIGRNVSAALRETANAAVVMEMRQVEMMKCQDAGWFKEEHRRHDLIRDQLASLVMQLESIQSRVKELREF